MASKNVWMLGVALAAVTAAGCGKSADKASLPASAEAGASAALGVKVVAPAPSLSETVLRASGSVRSKNEATLSAPATGTLLKVNVKVGDRVKKGAVLAQLDTANVRAQVEQAQAAKALAEAARDGARLQLDRTRQLAEGGSAPKSTLEQAEIGLRQAEAQVAQATAATHAANEALRDHTLFAPFDGVITARQKNVGDTVAMMPPTPIFQIVDVDALEVRALVPEALADRITGGSTLQGSVNPSGAAFQAKVSHVSAVVDPQSRTVEVLADVVKPAPAQLRAGSLVEVRLAGDAKPEGEAVASGLFLPAQAVKLEGTEGQVWLVEGGALKKRSVKAERVLPGYVRVLSGLSAQDRVVADASLDAQEGARVQVVQ